MTQQRGTKPKRSTQSEGGMKQERDVNQGDGGAGRGLSGMNHDEQRETALGGDEVEQKKRTAQKRADSRH